MVFNAVSAGYSYYFTGKVCKWGHIVPRWVKSGNCVDCHLVEVKKSHYRNRHSPRRVMTMEEKAERRRAHYYANREELLQKAKEYREANKEKISQQNRDFHLRKKKEESQKELP